MSRPAVDSLRERYLKHVAEAAEREKRTAEERRPRLQPVIDKVCAEILALANDKVNEGQLRYTVDSQFRKDLVFQDALCERLKAEGIYSHDGFSPDGDWVVVVSWR